ncbi:ComE operon protein 2 [Edaphobacillus lindanitolerans]|uniref:ComE operon protein 2 n=1 Tax=Edaphobacillus lindanitolerans TaxID=550447 RepID=A0A1U7PLV6_9BACI|nr:ComE operon protein 2 [Edaphobacillus lindanitolerans]SIT82547.1 dCMP deaminase [Edaphobacillus lindanitolerans]
MERITWDQFFMAQSHLLALRSTCTRLAVGATVVRDNRIVAGGYNGSISGGDHCIDKGCYVVDNHCIRTIHAEMNALLQCAKYGSSVAGAEIYVTHFPCLQCTKSIIQAGISKLVYAKDYKNHEYAVELLAQAGVQVIKVPFDEGKIDFLAEKKLGLYEELIGRLEEAGADPGTVADYEKRVKELFV